MERKGEICTWCSVVTLIVNTAGTVILGESHMNRQLVCTNAIEGAEGNTVIVKVIMSPGIEHGGRIVPVVFGGLKILYSKSPQRCSR